MEKEVELERIKSMVLAKCEQLCPHGGDRYVLDNCLTIMNFDGWDLRNKYGGRGFPEFTIRIHKSIDALSSTWFIAYRLLGLESRAKEQETLVKALRSFTGCSSADCRAALEENEWDCYKATVMIRSSGPTIKQLIAEATKDKDAEIARLRSALADLSSEAKRTWTEWYDRMVNGSGEGSQRDIFATQVGKLAQAAENAQNAMKGGQCD